MENQIQTAYVLADQDAPCTNSVKYGKVESKRAEMLSEAYSIISSMTDKQFDAFLDMLRKEFQ